MDKAQLNPLWWFGVELLFSFGIWLVYQFLPTPFLCWKEQALPEFFWSVPVGVAGLPTSSVPTEQKSKPRLSPRYYSSTPEVSSQVCIGVFHL